ncbi:alpha/beta hydrolase [Rhizobiaceae bacterium BDR2-2]|uniref:Alpha/beta hydrolase n=1 Tax=Ectorhizobium quercum TaxID=2965071 RepID=A0AAE3SV16_9HYPH|nr:alpha/beta hydrolase [Ectorhizobium quercum]MCX8996489.1 alpha/beta hydrolase [Ectorhizobium quercum]
MPPDIERLESPTGASLAFCRWQPVDAPPRAVLLVCHGLGEHARRYGGFAGAMAKRGLAVLAHDHRGHGLTTAPDAPRGRFAWREGADTLVADVLAMRDHAEALYPGLPAFLFGHSLGGLIALNAALEAPERFAGAAPWNMNAVPGRFLIGLARFILKAERALKGSDVPADLVPRLTIEAWNRAIAHRRTDADWLSHDPAEVDAFLADPLCGHPASVSLWLDIFDLIAGWPQRAGYARARALPFFLAGGDEDPGTDGGKAVTKLAQTMRTRGFLSVKLAIYRNTRHDTLHDIGREEAIAELGAWCDSCLERAP